MGKRNGLAGGLIWCVAAAFAVGILAYACAPMFAAWENILLDWHLRRTPVEASEEKIVLILGGDVSMIRLDSWPWPRETHARLIDGPLKNARVVAYDVFLVDKTTEEQDALLARAIAGHGNVVLGNAYRSDGVLLQPLERFGKNAGTGYFNFYPDSDWVVRRYSLAKRVEYPGYTELSPSFVLAVLEAAGYDPLIDRENRLRLLDTGQEIRLDDGLNAFQLPVESGAYPVYEFADVLAGKVGPEAFEDAIVFVGISATGASDIVHTSSGYITGTKALADVTCAILSGSMLYRAGTGPQILFSAAILLACFAGVLLLPGHWNWSAVIAAAALALLAPHGLFRLAGIYLQAAPLCAMAALGGVLQMFYLRVARESQRRQEMLMSMIDCLVSAIDAKDPVTAGHSQRVSRVAVRIAEKMKLKKKDIENLRFAGLIHDIGKIGISDAVLNKPGRYTAEEYEEMKQHPAKGAKIMEQANLPAAVVAGILEHHERPDGKGYPGGKTEPELHLFAEIIKIADVYDALSSKRQYKEPWPLEKVCQVLEEGRGVEFNPRLTDLLLEELRNEKIIRGEQ